MNSNGRFQLSSLLQKDQLLKACRQRDSLRERVEGQRIFGKDITNQSKQLRRVQSKSINGVMKPHYDLKKQTNKTFLQPLKVEKTEQTNPQLVSEYAQGILKYEVEREMKSMKATSHAEISETMRASLIDGLVDAHLKFKLLPETLFKAVRIVDKMLLSGEVSKTRYNLLGVASLFIASKYQEIYPPHPKSFVSLSKSNSSSELVDMESRILKLFNFELVFTTSFNFLQRIANEYKLTDKEKYLSQYLLELSLLDNKFISASPQLLACAAAMMTSYLLKKQLKINYEPYRLTEADVKICAKDLCVLLQSAPKSTYQMSRRKFSSLSFCQVSKIYLSINTDNL